MIVRAWEREAEKLLIQDMYRWSVIAAGLASEAFLAE